MANKKDLKKAKIKVVSQSGKKSEIDLIDALVLVAIAEDEYELEDGEEVEELMHIYYENKLKKKLQ